MPEDLASSALWTLFKILVALVLVLLNGFFVLVEFALVKIRRTRLQELVAAGSARARLALGMHSRMDEYLSACQLGITMASLALGWIGEPAFAHLFETVFSLSSFWSNQLSLYAALVASFALITFLHIVVGEQAPKMWAVQEAEIAILWAAPLMRVCYFIFYVPLTVLTKASNACLRLVGFRSSGEIEAAVTDEELRHVLAHSHKRGEFSLDRLLLFENALDFSQMTTAEIMLPLSQVDLIDTKKPWKDNLRTIQEKRHSRYLLAEGDEDRIIGMLHIKDLGVKALEQAPDLDLTEFRRDIFTIRDSVPLETLLRAFQRRRQHLALVKNSSGENVGIITLEDLLEELVGEIVDEFDVGADSPVALGDFIGEGRIELNLSATNAQEAIRRMLRLLAGGVGLDVESTFASVWKRESNAPTGLGRGVAIPHARLPDLAEPCVAFARCPEGIDFKASDGVPATMIFLILTPESVPLLQVKLLARIAGLMESGYLTSRLQEATRGKEVMEIIRAADVAATL